MVKWPERKDDQRPSSRAKARGEYTVPPLPLYAFKACTTLPLAVTVLLNRHTWPAWCSVGVPAFSWKCRAIHANGRSFYCFMQLYYKIVRIFNYGARASLNGQETNYWRNTLAPSLYVGVLHIY